MQRTRTAELKRKKCGISAIADIPHFLFYQFFYHAARKSGSLERDSHFKALHIRLFFLFLDPDMQVCELHRVDDIGSAAHKVGCILVLGEGDDFTDAVGAGQQHDKTVYAVGQSCVRRNAVLEGREQETEFFIGFLFGEADDLKHLLLDVALVDTDTAAAEFDAVEDNVVCFRTDAAGICIDAFPILFHRHGERMVHGYITVFLLGPLKKREVHDPEEIELVVVDKAQILAQFQGYREDLWHRCRVPSRRSCRSACGPCRPVLWH